MANYLAMSKINGILDLHREGWSQRRIAEALGVDRKTVAAHLAAKAAKRAKAPTGEAPTGSAGPEVGSGHGPEEGLSSGPATEPGGSTATAAQSGEVDAARTAESPMATRSACGPWEEIIKEMLELGLTAQRIHQDLAREHGFRGGYPSVRRFVARLQATRPLPFRRVETAPGEEAQVDFGMGIPLSLPDGRRRRTHVLRVVLSHSRKGYSEVVEHQTTESFIRALEHAFESFGGVPRTLIIDNLRAAVSRVDWFEPELNPKVRSFCEHYGVVILPTRPAMPRHKGKVERGVDYVQENALKGRSFSSLREQNDYLREWEEHTADLRIHGTTKKQVRQLFLDQERPALRALPKDRYPCFEESSRKVHRDGHIEVAKAYYSVPPEYMTREVWVRWNDRTVRVFNHRFEQIAIHSRKDPGQFSTLADHIANEKITGVERGAEWLLKKVSHVGPETTRWGESMLIARGIEGVRVLQGLVSLTKRYSSSELEAACKAAWQHQAYQLRTVRKLLERRTADQQVFEFLEEHSVIRPLAEYGQFVHDCIQGGIDGH